YLRGLFERSWLSFGNAVIVIAAVLTLGVMQGIAVGIALSLVLLIHMTTHPEGAVLGQLPGTQAYRDVRRHPEAVTFPGLLIWRIGGDLFFASVGRMRVLLNSSVSGIRPEVKHVLLDFSSVNFIDVSACDELLTLIKKLQNQGVTIAFARVRDIVRESMKFGGIEAVVGAANFYERITDGVRAWQR